MGPLFSAAVVVVLIATVLVLALVVARTLHGSTRALVLAVLFTLGAMLGTALVAVAAVLVLGTEGVLESSTAVLAYLACLAAGGVLGGVCAVILGSRVLTRRSTGRPTAAGELQRYTAYIDV